MEKLILKTLYGVKTDKMTVVEATSKLLAEYNNLRETTIKEFIHLESVSEWEREDCVSGTNRNDREEGFKAGAEWAIRILKEY